jgi:hypothetical protein
MSYTGIDTEEDEGTESPQESPKYTWGLCLGCNAITIHKDQAGWPAECPFCKEYLCIQSPEPEYQGEELCNVE